MEQIKEWLDNFFKGTGSNILVAAVVLVAGVFVVKVISRIIKNSLHRTPIEKTATTFIISVINFVLYAVIIYLVAITLFPNLNAGIIAVMGSAALAVGLALKDSLSDFASGIMIIFNKPFKEGDYIEVAGYEGTIRAIHLLHTEICTSDNKKIVINNSRVNSNAVVNYSARPTRRVDLTFAVAYGTKIDDVKALLGKIAEEHPLILKTPAPLIRLYEHGDSGLIFRFRVWVNNADYWTVYYDLNEQVYNAFEESNITIPYNHVTVNIEQEDK